MVELTGEIEMDVTPRVQRKVDKISKTEHYPSEDLIPELPSNIGPQVWIPRKHIFGIQLPKEYEERKRLLAVKAFEEDPEFLDKKPIIACLIPEGNGDSRIVIIDGHHRFRESGRLRIKSGRGEKQLYDKVACRVFTPEEMAELLNKTGLLYENVNGSKIPYTAELLIEEKNRHVDEALEEFHNRMSETKTPRPLSGITSMQQLQAEYSQPPAHFAQQ